MTYSGIEKLSHLHEIVLPCLVHVIVSLQEYGTRGCTRHHTRQRASWPCFSLALLFLMGVIPQSDTVGGGKGILIGKIL